MRLTKNASRDEYTDDDYMEMYLELRAGKGLRPFVVMLESAYTAATWSKYERGLSAINRTMRQELRRAVGLPELMPTVTEAIAHVSPDAEVVSVTDAETPDRLILAFSGDEGKTIVLNGEITVNPGVTKVTSETIRTRTENYYRPALSTEIKALVEADGRTIAAIIAAGLETKHD